MANTKFIPQLWAASMLDVLQNNLVYANLYNTDYEGLIKAEGDTVHIGLVGTPTVKDFKCNIDMDAPEDVNAEDLTLVIDQAKYFNISICDIERVQSAADLFEKATDNAGFAFRDICDAYLGGQLSKSGKANAGLGTEAAPTIIDTPEKAYAELVKMRTNLSSANVPMQGRSVVVPSEFVGFMLQDSRFVAVSSNQAQQNLTGGQIFQAAGFTIYESNNVPTTTVADKPVYDIVASYSGQGTFAQQILKVEAYRPENRFSDAVKGLHVYGAKVLRPEAVAVDVVGF